MKIGFFLQRRFAYVGHAMAITFRKKYGINEFCGYVTGRSGLEFLKSQKDIPYSALLLEEDIQKQYKNEPLDPAYLKHIEREYGAPNLWTFLETDRIIRYGQHIREYPYDTPAYTHEEMMRITQVMAKNIISFLQKEKPDVIYFSVVGSLGSMLLYYVARKMGIKTCLIRSSRIGIKYSLTEDYKSMGYINQTFHDILKNQPAYRNYIDRAEKFLKDLRDKALPNSVVVALPAKPVSRRKQFSFLSPRHIKKSALWFFSVLWDYLSDKNRDDYQNIKPWHYLLDRVKRKVRILIGFDDLYDTIDLREDFAVFPLHYQPEASTMLYAPFFTDQLWLIKQIARSLPIHYKLYIKEHPAMFGYRPRHYYKELKKIPNVKLVRPTVTSLDLVKNAKLILTLSSNAGWEALLFKKPVITFGDGFYNTLPMVKKCTAIEELPWLIKEQLENCHYDEKLLIDFIAAIFKESADVDLIQLWGVDGGDKMEKKEASLRPLVDLLAGKLGLRPIDGRRVENTTSE